MPVELPELVVTSKSQTPEKIREILESQGYKAEDIHVESSSDETPADPPEPVVEVPANAGGEPAGDDDDDGDGEPVIPAQPAAGSEAPRKKTGSAKLKEKLQAKDQELAAIRAELDALKLKPATPPAAAAAPPVAETPKTPEPEPELRAEPKWADFENEEDQLAAYTRATAEFTLDKREFERDKAKREREKQEAPAREAAASAETELRRINDEFSHQVTAVKQEHPDFDREVSAIPPTPSMISVITRQKDGAQLALWLARNPDDLTALVEATKLPATSTLKEKDAAIQRVVEEVGKIRYLIGREGMPAGQPSRETPAAPPAAIPASATPPPAAAPTGAPPPKKPTTIAPVGSRGATTQKKLAQYTPDEMRALHPDEFRRLTELERKT